MIHTLKYWIEDKCKQVEKDLDIENTGEEQSVFKILRNEFISRINIVQNQQDTVLQSNKNSRDGNKMMEDLIISCTLRIKHSYVH